MSDPYNRNGPSEMSASMLAAMEEAWRACIADDDDGSARVYLISPMFAQPFKDADRRAATKRAFRYLRKHGEPRIQRLVERRLADQRKPWPRPDVIREYYERPTAFNFWRNAA